ACGTTLPSVIVTLQGIIQSTETAAQHVLDAADRSSAAVARLRDGVTLLSSAASREIPETGEAWDDVSQSLEVLASAIARIGDDNMPELDGITLVRRMRAFPAFRSVPILILTTESSDEAKQRGRAAGATGWITKPFDPAQLREVVGEVLRVQAPQ